MTDTEYRIPRRWRDSAGRVHDTTAEPHSGVLRVQGFQPTPVVPTLHPPGVSDSFRRALDEHNDRDWTAYPRDPHDPSYRPPPLNIPGIEAYDPAKHDHERRDDLREIRGIALPVAVFLALGTGIAFGLLLGHWLHLH